MLVTQVGCRMPKLNIFFSLVVLFHLTHANDPILPVRAFLQTNLIGYPVIHDKQAWVFDPEIALRRRRQFIEIHGDKGEKLIERLGLGIDGYDEERLVKQRQRDEGHLGGLNAYLP